MVEFRARNYVIWRWKAVFSMVAGVLRPELGPCLGAARHQSNFGAAFSGDSDQVTMGS